MTKSSTAHSTLLAIALSVAMFGTSIAQTPAATPAPPFDIKDSAAGDRWLRANNIDQTTVLSERWNLVGYSSEGVVLSGARLEHVVSDIGSIPHLVRRLERYAPAPAQAGGTTLSETEEYDVNCNTGMIRQTAITQYPAKNLGGAGVKKDQAGEWFAAKANPQFATTFDNICQGASSATGRGPAPGRGGGGRGGRGGRG